MLVNKFKTLCEGLDWFFDYGDYHWQNLNDLKDDTEAANQEIAFLLLWKDRDKTLNDYNEVTAETFEGEFLLVVRSKMDDPSHLDKYEKRISKVEDKAGTFQALISDCDNLFIKQWKESEVENVLDTNVDGLKVKFRIRHEL